MSAPHDHVTVLLKEAVEQLAVKKDSWYIDATFGRGGHTKQIIQAGGKVLALDWDEEAIMAGQTKFVQALEQGNLILEREAFSHLEQITLQHKIQPQGILFDFGTSTNQLMSSNRGFSFNDDGDLDMRMDQRLGVSAKDILALIPEKQLAEAFSIYGGESDAWKIAKAIKRSPTPVTTTSQLAELVERVKHGRSGKLHPATKVFQALRIVVNSELDEIESALPQALKLIQPRGRIVTISFHEGEDRLVKNYFRTWESEGKGTNLTQSPLTPSQEELEDNQRARSAKMRVFEKTT